MIGPGTLVRINDPESKYNGEIGRVASMRTTLPDFGPGLITYCTIESEWAQHIKRDAHWNTFTRLRYLEEVPEGTLE